MKPLVITHGACRDGFCAAWIAKRALPDAEFFDGFYGQAPPDVVGREVYIIDFSYAPVVMAQLATEAESLVFLDHHKTAKAAADNITGLPDVTVVFDLERSGAGIAWDYFNPGATRPALVNYVEDRDLWRHALPDSEAVNAWIGTLPFTFEAWGEANFLLYDELLWARQLGTAVLAKVKQYVAEVRKNARRIMLDGHNVPIVNAPQVDVSELGHALAEGETFAVTWWQRRDGTFQYSLRSIGDFDVSDVAKKFRGGGHKNAAGFESHDPPWHLAVPPVGWP